MFSNVVLMRSECKCIQSYAGTMPADVADLDTVKECLKELINVVPINALCV